MLTKKNTFHWQPLLFLLSICSVAALGGFLFGFDTGVVSGTNHALKNQFELTPLGEGWFVSSALIGCVLGAAIAGILADYCGRKPVLLLSACFFFLSALGCGYPPHFTFLIWARILGGVGVGLASMVAPLYISELSPPKHRGRLVSLFQLAVVIGIFASYFSNATIARIANCQIFRSETLQLILVNENWRGMFLAETIPALLFFLLLLFVPESPRFWAKIGQVSRAKKTLDLLLGPEEADRELADIGRTLEQESGRFLELFSRYRLGLLIAISLMFFSQVTGINVIMYYGNQVFEEGGFSNSFSYALQTYVGIANVLFTLLALWKIDSWGRKPLLKTGTLCILFALGMTAVLFLLRNTLPSSLVYGILPVLIIVFVASFAMSWGPIPWVVVSEIFPTRIRGRAASIGTLTIWASCILVAQTFPVLQKYLGPAACFAIYAGCMIPALLFIQFVLPETKESSLEEIENRLYPEKKVRGRK